MSSDRRQLSIRVDPKLVKELKHLGVELDKSLTDLLIEAIDLLLKKYEGKT